MALPHQSDCGPAALPVQGLGKQPAVGRDVRMYMEAEPPQKPCLVPNPSHPGTSPVGHSLLSIPFPLPTPAEDQTGPGPPFSRGLASAAEKP